MTETLTPSGPAAVEAPSAGVTSPETHAKLDLLEAWMRRVGPVAPPEPVHRFTPGLYSRELTMEADQLIVSRVHRFEHQYTVSRGLALVFVEGEGWRKIQAPHHGITKAGTRRVLRIIDEMTWTTFHPNPSDERDIAKLEAHLCEEHTPIEISETDLQLIEAEIDRVKAEVAP